MKTDKKIITILGLGYVGLPLAIEFSKKYTTFGYDVNKSRIKDLKEGFDRTLEVDKATLKKSKIVYTSEINDISDSNIYIVTVPTPVDEHNVPNMTFLSDASKSIGKVLKKNDIVIFESTVYPGATEQFCVPVLEISSGLKYNEDFFCGYSPERINPGDKNRKINDIKKIVSGSNNEVASTVEDLYSSIINAGVHRASSIPVAEAAKIIENIQRDVNIALINELAMIFNKMGLDTIEILEAAKTKWNYVPFVPGLVGGHCIGVDPYYLAHKAVTVGHHPEIILSGRKINENMGKYVADSVIKEMVKEKINPHKCNINILGLAFKENCPDLRNTKVPDIIKYLKSHGCEVSVCDPFADKAEAKELYNIDLINIKQVKNSDVIIICVAHDDFRKIEKENWVKFFKGKKGIIFDVKSIFPKDYFNDSKLIHWKL